MQELDLRALLILGLVAERPRHAYEVDQCIEQRSLREWTAIGFSSVYSQLARLQKMGLAVSESAPGEPGRPPRRVYRPTPEGRRQLAESTRRLLSSPPPQRSPVSLALLISMSCLPRGEVAEALAELARDAEERLAGIREREAAASERWSDPVTEAIFGHDRAMLEAERAWALEAAERLRSSPSSRS